MKIIVEMYYTYGKGDNPKLNDRFIIENTSDERKEIVEWIEEEYSDEVYGGDDFINKKSNRFKFLNEDDWDSPTGGYVNLYTYDEKINEIKEKYEKELKEIKDLFKEK